ncbi:hypothetical protein, partial [Gordonia terrae]|uniref:hypothetical protein n=1 Tax=Gordonia terrae TaxID=2055 RepID=UPI001EE64D8F
RLRGPGLPRARRTRPGPARLGNDTRGALRRLVHDRLRARVTSADSPRRRAQAECVAPRKRWDARTQRDIAPPGEQARARMVR